MRATRRRRAARLALAVLGVSCLTLGGCGRTSGQLAAQPQLAEERLAVLIEVVIARRPMTRANYDAVRQLSPALPPLLDRPTTPTIPLIEIEREARPTDREPQAFIRSYVVRTRLARSAVSTLKLPDHMRLYRDIQISMGRRAVPSTVGIGSADDVARLLEAPAMWQQGMTGKSVFIGIVDSGLNAGVLSGQLAGCSNQPPVCFDFSEALSDGGTSGITPGANWSENGRTHATMVAFDALIAAPQATIFDVIISPGDVTTIGEVLAAYGRLAATLTTIPNAQLQSRPPGIILVNSWGVRNPAVEDPNKEYIENAVHPLSKLVSTLGDLGVDIVFAAGECSPGSQDPACTPEGGQVIYGANSYTRVVSVAAVDVNGEWQSYSAIGPGHIDRDKPDVAGYAEFSGFEPRDSGTSAAAPVVAGLIAAYRTTHPFVFGQPETSVDAMRDRIRRAVLPCFATGTVADYSERIGRGVVTGLCLLAP